MALLGMDVSILDGWNSWVGTNLFFSYISYISAIFFSTLMALNRMTSIIGKNLFVSCRKLFTWTMI
jgi:hypothetical protein